MGQIYRRQTLRFQVLIWAFLSIFTVLAQTKAATVDSKDAVVSPEVQTLVQKAAKKQDFSKELKQITKLKTSPTPSLVAVFKDANRPWQERWFSAMALSKFPTDDAKQVLIQGSKDTLSIIRSVSVQALAVFDDEVAGKAILESLGDSSLLVRDSAVKALGKIKDRNAVDLLARELFDQHNYYRGQPIFGIRENIIEAMGNIGSMKAVDPLMKIFQGEGNAKLKVMACSSLEKIVKPESTKKEISQCPEFWISWYKTQNAPTASKK